MKTRIRNRAISIVLALSMVLGVVVPATTPQADAVIGAVITTGLKLSTSVIKGTIKMIKHEDNYKDKSVGQMVLGVYKNAADDLLGTSFGDQDDPIVVNNVDLSEVEATLKDINTTLEKQNASIYQLESTVTSSVNKLSKDMDSLGKQIKDSTKQLEYNTYLDTFFEFFNQYYEGLSYYDEQVTSMLGSGASEEYQKNVYDRFYRLEDVEYSGSFHSSVDKLGRYLQGNYISSSPGSVVDVLSQYYILAYKGAGKSDADAQKAAAADTEDMIGYIYYAYSMGVYYEQAIALYQTAAIEKNGTGIYTSDFGTKLTQGQIDSSIQKLWSSMSASAGSIVAGMKNNYYKDAATTITYQAPSGVILNRTLPANGNFEAEWGSGFWLPDPADDLAQYFSKDFCSAFEGLVTYEASDCQIRDSYIRTVHSVSAKPKTVPISVKYGNATVRTINVTYHPHEYYYAGGFGSEEYPYLIQTPEQFQNISHRFPMHFKLVNDLDFKGSQITTQRAAFTGTLDGNGCTIKNAVLSGAVNRRDYDDSNLDLSLGLFKRIEGTVKNLTLSNISVTGTTQITDNTQQYPKLYVGTFTGFLSKTGKIENCVVENCTINTTFDDALDSDIIVVGGVAGQAEGTLDGVSCIQTNITAENRAVISDTSSLLRPNPYDSPCTILGGLVGYATQDSTITRCGVYDPVQLKARSITGAAAGTMFGCVELTDKIKGNIISSDTAPVCEKFFNASTIDSSRLIACAIAGSMAGGTSDGNFYYRLGSAFDKLNILGTIPNDMIERVFSNMESVSTVTESSIKSFFKKAGLTTPSLVYDNQKLVPATRAKDFDAKAQFTAPTKLNYTAGEYFDPSGMTVYQQIGSNKPSGYLIGISLSGFSEPLTAGNHTITATMPNGASTTFTIKVAAKPHIYVVNATTEPTCTTAGTATYVCTGCDDVKTNQTLAALGHDYVTTEGYPATCTEDGLTDKIECSRCGDVKQEQTKIEKLGHDFETTTILEPTCTAGGIKQTKCTRCDDATTLENIKPTGHTYQDTVTAPTCDTPGFTKHICSVCQDTYTDSYTAPVEHAYDNGTVTKPATCSEEGEMTYTCTICKKSYKTAISKTAHNFVAVVTDPTHVDAGYTTYTCSICQESYTSDYTSPVGHTYDNGTVTKPATCTEEGEMTYACSCGNTHTEPIAVIPHDYKDTVTEPTCLEMGYTTHTCSVCKDSYKDTYTAPTGHHFDNGVITTEPTCEKEGVKTFTCTCGETYTEAIARVAHTYKDTVTEPTCSEMGYTAHTCEVCKDSYKDTYTAAKGHQWDEGKTITEPTLITTGTMQQTCSVCKETQDITIPCITKCDGIDCESRNFIDVPIPSNWAHIGIDYVIKHGLFNGVAKNQFAPQLSMTRAMLVTVLYRMEGRPSVDGLKNNFKDVPSKKWYTDAVIWANYNGIVNGITAKTFEPNSNVTREQVAAILYRYAKFKGYDLSASADLSTFPDNASVSNYAKTALSWANAKGLITGSKENESVLILPRNDATRAQLAAILLRFAQVVSLQ